jgi:hypothetical protein
MCLLFTKSITRRRHGDKFSGGKKFFSLWTLELIIIIIIRYLILAALPYIYRLGKTSKNRNIINISVLRDAVPCSLQILTDVSDCLMPPSLR